MKRMWLLLIPLLFISCGIKTEYGNFTIHNDTGLNLLIQLSSKYEVCEECTLYSTYRLVHYPLNCKYTLKVKNKKKPSDDWTIFIFCPNGVYSNYYIYGNDTKLLITSDAVNGKSDDIEKIYPSE